MNLYFDIETIPTQNAEFIADIAKGIKPPATMKKAETIAEWEKNDKQSAIDDAVGKTSFDGAYGSIICIGYAIDDGEVISLTNASEGEILCSFFNALDAANPRNLDVTVIGHNVAEFDLKFLFKRCVVLDIKPPKYLPFKAKSWDKTIFDTMTEFAGYKDRISLDKLCKVLGIESNNTHTGADVYPMYKEGKIAEIASYCADDVSITREVYKRLNFI